LINRWSFDAAKLGTTNLAASGEQPEFFIKSLEDASVPSALCSKAMWVGTTALFGGAALETLKWAGWVRPVSYLREVRMTKQLIRAAAATVLGLSLTTGFAAADITNTGPDSNNTVNTTNSQSADVDNDNHVTLRNDNDQHAYSGDAKVFHNTTGGSASSGDASNSNSLSASVSINNSGSGGMGGSWSPAAAGSINTTGPDSNNTINTTNTSTLNVDNDNHVYVNNDNDQAVPHPVQPATLTAAASQSASPTNTPKLVSC
jgi:hypothetical protein